MHPVIPPCSGSTTEIKGLRGVELPKSARNRVSGPRDREARATHIYVFARSDGLLKIGISRNPRQRRESIQKATPDRLTLEYSERVETAREIETRVHAFLRPFRVSGEWFRCETKLAILAIDAVKTGSARLLEFLPLAVERIRLSDSGERERWLELEAQLKSRFPDLCCRAWIEL
jgi:hypothetical protein